MSLSPCRTRSGVDALTEKFDAWIVIVRGDAEGKEVRVALEFQDAESLLKSGSHRVGSSFINQLLNLFRLHDNWLIKTIIDEVRTPDGTPLHPSIPLFALLSKSRSRGLSTGALFIAETESTNANESFPRQDTNHSLLNTTDSYLLTGLSPIGFAAACADDHRLFTRFLTRLLRHPETFSDVSLLIPLQVTNNE
ncbi:MAG: hypothetical protein ACFFDP_04025 [Promethearchaeota archaeon]